MRLFVAALALFAAADEAAWRARQAEVLDLAELLGRSHHLRRICASNVDKEVFRERMAKLIELERGADRDALITRFNAGFAEARRGHRECDGAARRARRDAALRGDALVASVARGLAEPPAGVLTVAGDARLQAILAAGAAPAEGEAAIIPVGLGEESDNASDDGSEQLPPQE